MFFKDRIRTELEQRTLEDLRQAARIAAEEAVAAEAARLAAEEEANRVAQEQAEAEAARLAAEEEANRVAEEQEAAREEEITSWMIQEERMWKCVGCARFSRLKKEAVKVHVQGCKNCGIRKIVCRYCKKSFSQKYHHNSHVKEEHL